MLDPILELGTQQDIELNGQSPNDLQIVENQEEDLLIELESQSDIVLSDGVEDEILLVDSYSGEFPYEFYNGPYHVRPMLYSGQYLMTSQKIMEHNVTVEEIPIVKTTNPSGGQTVVIG